MRSYRCFFLELQSAIAGVDVLGAETDDAALRRAESLFREKGTQPRGYQRVPCP
jgi:hypothetical protein